MGFTEASEGDQCVFSNKLHIGDGGIFNVESLELPPGMRGMLIS